MSNVSADITLGSPIARTCEVTSNPVDRSTFNYPEGVEMIWNKMQMFYENRLLAMKEFVTSKDEIIAELKETLWMKDSDLEEATKELRKLKTENDNYRQEMENHILEMKRKLDDRERLIRKIKALMNLKTLKMNLLQMRMEFQPPKDSNVALMGSSCIKDETYLRRNPLQDYIQTGNATGSGDHCPEEDDPFEFLDEISQIREDIENSPEESVQEESIQLLQRIRDVKDKMRRKLAKNKDKRAELHEMISSTSSRFEQAQTDIEEIRKNAKNNESSREQIRCLVSMEKEFIEVIEKTETQRRKIVDRIYSFKKALNNLNSLEKILVDASRE